MPEIFKGRWRARVLEKNAGFAQRVVVSQAAGAGTYAGTPGTVFEFDGDSAEVRLQWNNNAGSGWQDSATVRLFGSLSPLVLFNTLKADDNFPANRDGDFDDLVVRFEHLDAPFEVLQRPFALDRGTLVMLPDGVFEASQGTLYMGVRIRNTWFFDWQSAFPATGMKIGIAPTSRLHLQSIGINIIDSWSVQEQRALGQVMDNGYVRVDDLPVGGQRVVYFKADFSNARPGTPEVGFVAQRAAFDPAFDAPTRVVHHKIFVSRSAYDPVTKELTAEVPEGRLHMRLKSAIVDRKAASKAAKDVRDCLLKKPGSRGLPDGRAELQSLAADLRGFLQDLLAGKRVDPCRLKGFLDKCACKDTHDCGCDGGDPGGGGPPHGWPGGGLGDGSGADDWCRFQPVAWLPVEFEYRLDYKHPFPGQHGPLAFQDPWWKVVLIILAVLLAIGSLIADYVGAAEDTQYHIGKIVAKGGIDSNADCALSDLNGSRGVDLGMLDAQGDDVNNGSPISALDTIIQIDRSDNGDLGIQDAVLGNVVWKSGGTSGTTRGVVDDIAQSTSIDYDGNEFISGVHSFTNQVGVAQIIGMEQPLSQGGDSGSVWIDMASGRPVALNFAGPADDSGTSGTGSPIRLVCSLLNIRFNP